MGLKARNTRGSSTIWMRPPSASTKNQTSVIGPKNDATWSVPRDCTANTPTRMIIVSGTTYFFERGRNELHALDGREHRDGRRQNRIAVKKGRAHHAKHSQEAGGALGDRLAKCHQRKRSAFAVIVGAQQDDDVLQGNDQRQRPQDQRQHAENRVRPGQPMLDRMGHGFAERIERAGSDIAVNNADRAKRQRPELAVAGARAGIASGGCRGDMCHLASRAVVSLRCSKPAVYRWLDMTTEAAL